MTCREFTEFLDAYLAKALTNAEQTAFDAHLAECPDCVSYLGSYRRTVDLCQSLRTAAPLPADVPTELVDAILAARKPRAS